MKIESIKKALLERIVHYEDILKIQMTKENIHEITYADKLTAMGNINGILYAISLIDPTFTYDIKERLGIADEKYTIYN